MRDVTSVVVPRRGNIAKRLTFWSLGLIGMTRQSKSESMGWIPGATGLLQNGAAGALAVQGACLCMRGSHVSPAQPSGQYLAHA
jgi:hypothetical protein